MEKKDGTCEICKLSKKKALFKDSSCVIVQQKKGDEITLFAIPLKCNHKTSSEGGNIPANGPEIWHLFEQMTKIKNTKYPDISMDARKVPGKHFHWKGIMIKKR